jgi:hypothetical protein
VIAPVVVLPAALSEPAVDDDAAPLVEVLVALLRKLRPGGHVDVADLFLQLIVFVVVVVVGDGKPAQRGAVLGVAELGI